MSHLCLKREYREIPKIRCFSGACLFNLFEVAALHGDSGIVTIERDK